MNSIRTAGVGVALALAGGAGFAQSPPPAPAATLGKITVADDPVARGAAPDTKPSSLFPPFRTQTTPPTTGGSTLPPPKPVDGQPGVTETRNPPGGGSGVGPMPFNPGAGPMPFNPGVGPGPLSPGGPVPFVPGSSYPTNPTYPSYVMPGAGVYGSGAYGTPGPVGPAPQPTYVVPGPVLSSGAVAPVAPPIGGGVPCDPYLGSGGGGVPVSPSAPGMMGTPTGYVAQPEAPYWQGGWSPLFPRARAVADSLFDNRITLGGEYLLWFVRGTNNVPPLLTTSAPAFNGIIGQGNTSVIYPSSGQSLTDTRHSGARISAQYRLTDLWGIDGNIWFLSRNGEQFRATSDRYPLLARPFFNVNTGSNFSQLVAFPGVASGSATVNSETSLWGGEINARRALLCWGCGRIDALVGFRNFNLSDEVVITEQFARTPNAPPAIGVPSVNSGVVQDRFRTENHFYGVNLGLAGEVRRGVWYLNGRVGVGLGSVYQKSEISGSQNLLTNTGGVATATGGLLALPGANIGTFTQTKFGVLPDAGLTLGVYLTPNLRMGVGYNIMYLNSVARAGQQIDTGLDVTRIPNFPLTPTPAAVSGTRPSGFPLRTTDVFVQGLTFSLFWSF